MTEDFVTHSSLAIINDWSTWCRSLSSTGRHLGLLMGAIETLGFIASRWRGKKNTSTPTSPSFAYIKKPRWRSVELNDGRHLRSVTENRGPRTVCIRAKWPFELIPVSVAWSDYEFSTTPLDGMLVHRRATPSIKFSRYPFIYLGGERHCESQVSCPRTQRNLPAQGSNPDRSLRSWAH